MHRTDSAILAASKVRQAELRREAQQRRLISRDAQPRPWWSLPVLPPRPTWDIRPRVAP